MTNACQEFRGTLESKLSGSARELCELSWHEHLLECTACRTLLQEEEALEIVLSTLPDPVLPPRLAERVLARLRTARRDASRLDELLELADEIDLPSELATHVLDGLRPQRTAPERAHPLRAVPLARHLRAEPPEHAPLDLDALLELDRELDAPPGLARRVLDGLQSERVAHARPRGASTLRVRRRTLRPLWMWPLAASVLLALVWAWWSRSSGTRSDRGPELVQSELPRPSTPAPDAPPDLELLSALDVLENWTALMEDDLDVELSTFEPADEVLLEYPLSQASPEPEDHDEDPSQG